MAPRTPRLSVRARMTLWNVSVVALTLIISGGALRWGVERVLLSAVDRDLQDRAQPFLRGPEPRHPRPPRGEGGPPDHDPGQPPPPPPHEEWQGGGPGGPGEPGGMRPPPPPEPREGNPWRPGFLRVPLPPVGERLHPRVLGRDGFDLRGLDASSVPFTNEGFRRALDNDQPNYEKVASTTTGEMLRVYSHPVRDQRGMGQLVGVVQVARPLGDIDAALGGLTLTLLLMAPAALLLTGVGGALLTDRALRPVREITSAASRIGEQNLSDRLPQAAEGGDEFERLSAMLNAMLERLEGAFQRQRRFASDASHELRTPLSVIKAHSSLALEAIDEGYDLSPEDRRSTLRAIDEAADRADRLVRDLLLLARAGIMPVRPEPVALSDILAASRDAALTTRRAAGQPALAPIEVAVPGSLFFVSDRDHLLRLFSNLLDNALRHTPADGRVCIRAREHEEGGIVITVADTGEGIPAEHLSRVMEPFYRADAARSRRSGGAGLGLAICRSLAETLGGGLRLESALGTGTIVTVILPGEAPLSALPQNHNQE